jgi:Helix-turn-helix domain
LSHAANIYVKKLKVAPTGDVITASERALLWYLADCHSEEAGGIAWPSMKTLADHMNLSERQARRIVTAVETKGIIGRIAQTRENGSSQSNCFYFVELQALPIAPAERFAPCVKPKKNGGKPKKTSAKPVKKGVEATPPTLTPMSGGAGHQRQGDPDTHDRGTLTPVSALEAPIEASSEAPVETPVEQATAGDDDHRVFSSQEKETARACEKPAAPRPDIPVALCHEYGKWEFFKAELLRKLEQLPEKIREGCVAEYNAAIRDTELIDDSCDGDDMTPTWTISSVDPDDTRRALAALAANVKAALWKTAKGNVQLKVYGGEE